MKTILYCFSGTGNSLWVARSIAKELGDTEVVPMTMASASGEGNMTNADNIGFVFPVYMWGLPLVVARFLKGFGEGKGKYVFSVATYGGSPGTTLVQASGLLAANDISMAAGFGVTMPGNYTPMCGAIDQRKQEKMFGQAAEKVRSIAQAVRDQRRLAPEKSNFAINWFLSGLFYPFCAPRIPAMDRDFWTDEKCNGCGICAKVCPVGNIMLTGGKPAWQHRCEQCMACLQWCPREAVQLGKKTPGRKRYHHPDIRLQDMTQTNV